MWEFNYALLEKVAWLAYLPVFPVPLLLLLLIAAWLSFRGSRRYVARPTPDPLFTQVWVWVGSAVLLILTYLVVNFLVLGWPWGLMLAAWSVVPAAVIGVAVRNALVARRRWLERPLLARER